MVSTALNNGASSPIDIQISGGKQSEARRMAREVRSTEIREIPGVADARVRQRLNVPY